MQQKIGIFVDAFEIQVLINMKKFLTDEKLLIVGAAGMIGSNMVQTAAMLGLTPNICLYDIYEPGLKGVLAEMDHCAFPGVNLTATEKYCPDVKHVVVIFNPADVTALTALIRSGLAPEKLTSLAALDSTRLQEALAQEFGVQQDKVTGAHTYGGHGEAMAVFASQVKIDGKPLAEMGLSEERWAEIKHNTVQGGSNIIKLRGRSSFQSPAYNAVKMIEGAMGGEPFTWPAGTYVNNARYQHVFMAMPTVIDKTGVHFTEPEGTPEEMAALDASYEHLCKMRDEIISLGIVPALEDWKKENPNL